MFIYIIMEILIKLIFEMPLKPKKLFIMFVISLIIISISGGLIASEISTYKIIENEKTSEKDREFNISMQNNLIIDYIDSYDTEIIYENREDILVEFYVTSDYYIDVYSHNFVDNYYTEYGHKKYVLYTYYTKYAIHNKSINDYINLILDNIKNKEIIINDYSVKAVIHLSEENYNKLDRNLKDYRRIFYE